MVIGRRRSERKLTRGGYDGFGHLLYNGNTTVWFVQIYNRLACVRWWWWWWMSFKMAIKIYLFPVKLFLVLFALRRTVDLLNEAQESFFCAIWKRLMFILWFLGEVCFSCAVRIKHRFSRAIVLVFVHRPAQSKDLVRILRPND